MGYIFVADSMGLSAFKFLWWAPKDKCVMQAGMVKIMIFSKKSKNRDFFRYISDINQKTIKANYYVKYCYTQCVNTS